VSRWRGRGGLLLASVLVIAGALAWSGRQGWLAGAQDAAWARVQREGVLRVAMDASYPPFDIEEGGTFRGYDVDLAQEIGRRLGVEVTFINVGYDGLYDVLQAGRCDAVISALPYDPQRTNIASFTGGYFDAGQVIVAPAGGDGLQGPEDLAGRRVAVEMGSQAHQEALALRDRGQVALEIVTARSSDEALDMVHAGAADAAIADAISARLALHSRPGLAIHGAPLTDESFVIAVSRGNPQLFAVVKGALDQLRGEGWLEQLAERWL